MSLLAVGLVLAGAWVLIAALRPVRDLIAQLPSGDVRRKWYILAALILLFIAGYVAYAAARWRAAPAEPPDFIAPGVFFLGACFVLLVCRLSLETALGVRRISSLEAENRTDPVTGIYNRRYMERRLKEEAARASRYDLPLSVLLLDIDHFKEINDARGHAAGDTVLEKVGQVTEGAVRDSDIVARFGGDEFLVILPNTPGPDAARLAERLRQSIEHAAFAPQGESDEGQTIRMTVSVGVASRSRGGRGVDGLLKDADDALYKAKQEGRNRVKENPSEGGRQGSEGMPPAERDTGLVTSPVDPHPPEVFEILRRRGPVTRIAVVGASNDPSKYGNIIVRNLAAKGYTVLPVNPHEKEIAGLPAYPDLAAAPGPIHLVDFVTPPGVTRAVLEKAAGLGLPAIWLQDGSYDDSVLAVAAKAPYRTVYEACIMVASNFG